MEACPICKRKFHNFEEWPFIYVEQASIKRADEVPSVLHNLFATKDVFIGLPELLNKLPREVLSFFNENPQENKMQHTDGFVYYRREWSTKEEIRDDIRETVRKGDYILTVLKKFFSSRKKRSDDISSRKKQRDYIVSHKNYAPEIKDLLENSEQLRNYTRSLEDCAGKVITPDKLFPPWNNKGHIEWLYSIPQRDFQISLQELSESDIDVKKNMIRTEPRDIQIGLHHGASCISAGVFPIYKATPLFVLGNINYEGRISDG